MGVLNCLAFKSILKMVIRGDWSKDSSGFPNWPRVSQERCGQGGTAQESSDSYALCLPCVYLPGCAGRSSGFANSEHFCYVLKIDRRPYPLLLLTERDVEASLTSTHKSFVHFYWLEVGP